jgi:hypothetical protein
MKLDFLPKIRFFVHLILALSTSDIWTNVYSSLSFERSQVLFREVDLPRISYIPCFTKPLNLNLYVKRFSF